MKTREQAEKRALELYPDTHISTVNQLHEVSRKAYLQGWEESQETKLREAAENFVTTHNSREFFTNWAKWSEEMGSKFEELEKSLK